MQSHYPKGNLYKQIFNAFFIRKIYYYVLYQGYLRHVIQETAAGHIVRVLDENGQPLERSKVWCTNQFFQVSLQQSP